MFRYLIESIEHHRETQRLLKELIRMSEAQATAIAAIQAALDKLSTDTTATLSAIATEVADLKAQVAGGATLDPTALLASIQKIDDAVTAALPPTPAPAPAA